MVRNTKEMGISDIAPAQSFFAVFCIESLSDELGVTGDKVYKLLSEDSDLLDEYVLPYYDVLHTQSKEYIVRDLKERMLERGLTV